MAGYVGAETRFEYTVVGDPVNEAARLTEAAKRHAQRLLASGETLRLAGADEAARWALDGEVLLRGRSTRDAAGGAGPGSATTPALILRESTRGRSAPAPPPRRR